MRVSLLNGLGRGRNKIGIQDRDQDPFWDQCAVFTGHELVDLGEECIDLAAERADIGAGQVDADRVGEKRHHRIACRVRAEGTLRSTQHECG